MGDWSSLFGGRPVLGDPGLTAPFTPEEIKKSAFAMKGDKAPGPDGFTMDFFHKFWEVLKEDLLNIFADLYNGSLDTGPMDYSYICLIPKKEGPKTADDFRPISLINCIQKIISKVLANRLELVMDKIISPTQTAFLKGRSILDSFATASEIICWGSKVMLKAVGVKTDFEKAYDRVN